MGNAHWVTCPASGSRGICKRCHDVPSAAFHQQGPPVTSAAEQSLEMFAESRSQSPTDTGCHGSEADGNCSAPGTQRIRFLAFERILCGWGPGIFLGAFRQKVAPVPCCPRRIQSADGGFDHRLAYLTPQAAMFGTKAVYLN